MKKSEMVLKMTRYYATQHVMHTSGYMTLDKFMEGLLAMQLDEGMNPPDTDNKEDAEISLPVYDDGSVVDRLILGWDKE